MGVDVTQPKVPEIDLSVECPFCEIAMWIKWPEGTQYAVTPK
jgi:hypothetical protein